MQTQKEGNGLSIASMVLGIVGLVLSCVYIGIIPCVIGLIFAIITLTNQSKKNGMAITGLITSIIGILIFIIMLFVPEGDDADTNNPDSQNATIISDSDDAATAKEPPGDDIKQDIEQNVAQDVDQEAGDEFIYPGESFEVGDLKITFLEYVDDFTDYEDSYGLYVPEDGYKYIMASFLYENIGDSGTEYVSIYDFDCYADNQSMEQTYLPDDSDFINANISPGRQTSFSVYFQVPTDSESIELEYTEIKIFSDNEFIKLKCR